VATEPLDAHLRFAIANKRLIAFGYRGVVRIAEPHDYGVKNGSVKLLVYQLRTTDDGHKKRASGWRLLEASQIEACTALELTFAGSRGEAGQRHMTWDELFARVS
jgi:hypothetical protein